ncbi:MAG: cyclodeaminase/cyclohydrolase family protein [Ktedonobacterales bacterium]
MAERLSTHQSAVDQPIGAFVAALGSNAPAPGGGAACALVGALAVALAEMVAQFTIGRPKYQAVEERAQSIITQTQTLRTELLAQMDADERAFQAVSDAYRLAKNSEEQRARRDAAIQTALHGAMQPPLRVMELSCAALDLAREVAESGNSAVASDAGCAALLGAAAVRAAALNVLANVVLLHDSAAAAVARARVTALEQRAATVQAATLAVVRRRMGIDDAPLSASFAQGEGTAQQRETMI